MSDENNAIANLNVHMFNLVNKFYAYMSEIYIEYGKIQKEDQKQSFSAYFLYKLFYNYGIKRRYLVTDSDLSSGKPESSFAVLYYHKSLKGYKTNEPITQLCRHMILDLNNMKILSLGIPKAVKFADFCTKYEINIADINSSFIYNENGEKIKIKYRVYKHPEGTMLTYNPGLKNLNAVGITNDSDNEDEDGHIEKTSGNTQKFTEVFQYATRKVVGTSGFGSTKTFSQMFEETNGINNTHLENIPESIMKDTVMVFNLEHPENRMVAPHMRNMNTLCAVYKLKNADTAAQEWKSITDLAVNDDNLLAIGEGFSKLAKDMVVPIHVGVFKKMVAEYNVNLYLPEVISSFEKKQEDNTKVLVPIDQVSLEQLSNIITVKNKYFQGYIIYGINGERTKLVNTRYRELQSLKGNKPITIEPWNMKNLFYIYWKLMREQKLELFLSEFQNSEYCTGPKNYTSLFVWFSNCVRAYAHSLFNMYQDSFVRHKMQKSNIPYSMKPLCGDLHRAYLETKCPTSITMVEQYLFTQPCGKVYWRIFNIQPGQQVPEQTEGSTQQNTQTNTVNIA